MLFSRTVPAIGSTRLQYSCPWTDKKDAYELLVDSAGKVLRKRLPGSDNEAVYFEYDAQGRLRQQIFADFEVINW